MMEFRVEFCDNVKLKLTFIDISKSDLLVASEYQLVNCTALGSLLNFRKSTEWRAH